MPRSRANYQTSELELVKNKLPDILTMKPDLISDRLRKNYSAEILPLAEVFNLAASELHHKWQAAVLAKVPLSDWVSGPGDILHIRPSSGASMRYLSHKLQEAPNELLQQVRTRQVLLEQLLEKMRTPCQIAYRPMLQWVEYDKLGDSSIARYPLSSDSAFGYNLLVLENLMDNTLHDYEKDWCRENNWPENESVPNEVVRKCSLDALQHLKSKVQEWWKDSAASPNNVPESLLAITSANLSVNRALLELAAIEARGMEAMGMNEQFLCELNRKKVFEVPRGIVDCGPEECGHYLREVLTSWFGHGGSMLQSGTFFQRPMNRSDINMVVLWSRQLQQMYIQERGGRGGPETARRIHGNPGNRFIFSMVMAGAFYCNASTAYEFTGHSNSTYAVFPDRLQVAKGKRETPPTHAANFFMQAYGQVFFANSDWDLRFERVREYAETSSIKRSCEQLLLRFAVKDRTSQELLVLHNHLQRLRDTVA